MAHVQYNGTRVSGLTRDIPLGKAMVFEVWGPQYDDGEYVLVSSDSSVVDVSQLDLLKPSNVRRYKAAANKFGPTVKLMVVAGKLSTGTDGFDLSNLQTGFVSGDWVKLNVQPNTGGGPFSDYFTEVIPAIADGLAEFNAAGTATLTNKAGFLLCQTYGEQSPGVTGKPSKNGNRLFNVQAEVTRDQANKITGVVPGQTAAGVTIVGLSQGEGATDATRKMLTSPTFNYDTPKRAVTHYFAVLKARYPSAYAELISPVGSFSKFVGALQSARYATDAAYATKMVSLSTQVLKQAKAWLEFRLQTIDHDCAVATGDVKALRAERAQLQNFRDELKKFKP
jgi:hypothetical protein